MTNETFKVISEFWLWPSVIIFIFLELKNDLRRLLSRIIKSKIFGQEIIFTKEVDRLQKETQILSDEVQTLISPNFSSDEALNSEINKILKCASKYPELGLITLSVKLEKEVRNLANSIESTENYKNYSFTKLSELLVNKGHLPKEIKEVLSLFDDLRNKIVHDIKPTPDEKYIFRMLDIGIKLLHIFRGIFIKIKNPIL